MVKGISKNDFCDLLNLVTKESIFKFQSKFYIQVDGVAMGSPLGPILDNISLSHHEENWLNKCSIELKPSFYKRYVLDIFVLFESPDFAHSFHKCMSSKHQNINFNVEQDNIEPLSFLDVKICHKNGKFVTSPYRKPTFSVVFANYEISVLTYQKRRFIHILLHRKFNICCDFKIFHFEIDHFEDYPYKKQSSPKFHRFVY